MGLLRNRAILTQALAKSFTFSPALLTQLSNRELPRACKPVAVKNSTILVQIKRFKSLTNKTSAEIDLPSLYF